MAITTDGHGDAVALSVWRNYLSGHTAIVRRLDAELLSDHGLTARDVEVLRFLAEAPDRRLSMSQLATRTMLTRSGVTRLIDGLAAGELVERVGSERDARVLYARLTARGTGRLAVADRTQRAAIGEIFLARFAEGELELLADLLARLPAPGLPLAGRVQRSGAPRNGHPSRP